MKNHTLTKLFSFLLLIASGACSKKDSMAPPSSNQPPAQTPDPMALFSVTNTDMRAPVKIKFKNNSQHADHYFWVFNDGSTSTEKEPERIFTDNGSFAVQLTVTGAGGKTDSKTSDVLIGNAPNVMYVKKVSIINADLSELSGVYIRLVNGAISWRSPTIYGNSLDDHFWNTNFTLVVRHAVPFEIKIFDFASSNPNGLFGIISIQPEEYMTASNHYPNEITVNQNGVQIKLEVEWRYEPR